MNKFSSLGKIVIVLVGSIILITATFSAVSAAEKRNQQTDAGSSAILLINQDYLPVLLKSIDEAQSEIFIAIFSFKAGVHKDSYPDRIMEHLAKAVKRNVKVKIILEKNSRHDDDLNAQNRQTGKLLAERGINVYFDSPRQTTHTKLIVIDKRLIILGSHNLTQSALKYNNEISLLLDSPDLAKRSRDYILKIIEEAK